jgi:hypothetical protein
MRFHEPPVIFAALKPRLPSHAKRRGTQSPALCSLSRILHGNSRMKYSPLIGLFALVLSGCMGPDGNPDGQPYADEPGGAIAAQPQINGVVAYNPQAPQPQDAVTTMILPPIPPTPPPAPPLH